MRVLAAAMTALLTLTSCLWATPAAAATSSASGSAWTDVTYRDRAGTEATYHLFSPAGQARGVLVYLDGDGQHAVDHPDVDVLGGQDGLVAVAAQRGLAVVVPRAPGSTQTWWQESPERNAAFVDELTHTIANFLGVPESNVWLVGYSGGAQLLSKHLLAQEPDLCTGGAVLLGGGGRPQSIPRAPTCPAWWITGTEDTAGYDALSDARAGAGAYAATGGDVRLSTPAGVDHDEVRSALPEMVGGAIDQFTRP